MSENGNLIVHNYEGFQLNIHARGLKAYDKWSTFSLCIFIQSTEYRDITIIDKEAHLSFYYFFLSHDGKHSKE